MSTKGVVDIVFCIDASASMRPCLDAVRRHVVDFIRGLESNNQRPMDWRIGFLAHSCDVGGNVFHMIGLEHENIDLLGAIYAGQGTASVFTTSLPTFQSRLERVDVMGDEATLVALDTAMDYPWRPRNICHRVVVCLTDEPFEDGAAQDEQLAALPHLQDKIQNLGVMLFLVAPKSDVFTRLSEVDKSEYEMVDVVGDGMRTVDFGKILSYIGKSLSIANLQGTAEAKVPRALFGQNLWGTSNMPIRGR